MEIPKPVAIPLEASAQVTGVGEITIYLIGRLPGQPTTIHAQAVFKSADLNMAMELARKCPELLARIKSAQSGLQLAPANLADRFKAGA